MCHGGQGRALTKDEAFGLDPKYHWPEPLLSQPYIQASCGKCHLAIYNTDDTLEGTDIFRKGQGIFRTEGCLGCHKARGVGGIIGPDLTQQVDKTKHEYSFQNVSGEQTVSNWLKEHFRDPEMVSPGSQMLKIDLPEEDLDALATFVMGLSKPDIPVDYFSVETLKEFKGSRKILEGSEIYSFTCSACHGKSGEGKDYKTYETGVPAIMNHDFLRVASEDFILFTLMTGRSLRQMSSWEPLLSGWQKEELGLLVKYLEAQNQELPSLEVYYNGSGLEERGKAIFAEKCVTCHGEEGKGGPALVLNQQDFLEKANKKFIAETILKGRNGSGMPAWPGLEKQEVNDLLAYFNSWYRIASAARAVDLPQGDPSEGALRYHYLCSRCHGEFGEGETGPAIFNRDFLAAAPESYLYHTIASGRNHTAMFGWTSDVYNQEQLGKKEIADLIEFMKSHKDEQADYNYAGPNPGDVNSGQALFKARCAECHGKEGEGLQAPALNNQEFLSAASNGYIMATITIGRNGTRMPSWGYASEEHPMLSGKERQDIVAFVRSWQRIRIKY